MTAMRGDGECILTRQALHLRRASPADLPTFGHRRMDCFRRRDGAKTRCRVSWAIRTAAHAAIRMQEARISLRERDVLAGKRQSDSIPDPANKRDRQPEIQRQPRRLVRNQAVDDGKKDGVIRHKPIRRRLRLFRASKKPMHAKAQNEPPDQPPVRSRAKYQNGF